MRTLTTFAFAGLLIVAQAQAAEQSVTPEQPTVNSPGVGERLGEQVDRGLNTLGQKLRKGWAEFRQSVDELSVQGRVYGRLHWDKALANAPIETSMQNENTIVLSGSVADEAAHMTAVKLAQDTVGVNKVIDHLTVSSTTITTVPPLTATPAIPSTPLPEAPKQ